MEQSVDAIAIVLIILCGIDPALRCNRVRAPWRILKAKAFYPVAEFAQGRPRQSAAKPAPNNNTPKLSRIIWLTKSQLIRLLRPFLSDRSGWILAVKLPVITVCPGLT